eukprot:3983804-Karenia_brevis.AAC.1
MTGLGDKNGFHKKPSEFWASDHILISPLLEFKCNHDISQHSRIEGGNSHAARLWTWTLDSAIASGIVNFIRKQI